MRVSAVFCDSTVLISSLWLLLINAFTWRWRTCLMFSNKLSFFKRWKNIKINAIIIWIVSNCLHDITVKATRCLLKMTIINCLRCTALFQAISSEKNFVFIKFKVGFYKHMLEFRFQWTSDIFLISLWMNCELLSPRSAWQGFLLFSWILFDNGRHLCAR